MRGEDIAKAFSHIYDSSPFLTVRAPGRINLIGEHTDYNDGFVLPASIDKAIYFCLAPRTDKRVLLYAADLEDQLEISLDGLKRTNKGWANFLIGVLKELIDSGSRIPTGFNLVFGGDVPLGAGLSSSAAIESGMAFALNELYDLNLSLLDMALAAQRAEHNFAGVRCGIMDMYASLMGKENQVIKIDCKNLEHEYLPFQSDNIRILLYNTGVSHNLAESEYNKRREECETGLSIIKEKFQDVQSFRDVNREMLDKYKSVFPEKVYNRCLYVISEEERMEKASVALQNSDFKLFGKLMFETHEGLRDLYEVSCEELDFLVELASDNNNVLGSRMMGGGFGGCTINLVEADAVDRLNENLIEKYQKRFNKELEYYEVNITDGCSVEAVLEKYSPQ